jgi:hypothetical protein
LFSVKVLCRLPCCYFLADNDISCLAFPTFVLPIDDLVEVQLPTTSVPSATMFDFEEKSALLRVPAARANDATCSGLQTKPSNLDPSPVSSPSPVPPVSVPAVRPCDTPNSAATSTLKLTSHELHRYLGFLTLVDYKVLEEMLTPHLVITGAPPMELGDVHTIPRGRHGRARPRSIQYLQDVYMDIGYGDGKSLQGTHCMVLVNNCTCFAWVYGL